MSSSTFVLQNLPTNEYLANPSLRTVDAFFLGGVFLLALLYICKSAAVQSLTENVGTMFLRRTTPSTPEALEADSQEKERLRRWVEDVLLGPAESLDPKNLIFILCIFVANASLAMFGATLIFSKGQDLMCTFLVAWGGLSAEMIRVIGFIRLSLELRSLHSRQWEMYLTWVYMVVVIAFMLLNNAIESGALRSSGNLNNTFLCYRQYSLPTSLLSSLLNLIFEVYAIIRLVFLLAPSFLMGHHRWDALQDIRLAMALSLLLMDLLTVVPDAIPVSIAAEYIPFSVAAVIVLVIFNREHDLAATTLSRMDSIPSTRMMEISRRDYDGNSILVATPRTSRSRSIVQRRGSSASRLGRYPRRSQIPPFSLGTISSDSSVRQKRGMSGLVINVSRCSPQTIILTPKSSSSGSFRISGSYETTTHGQVMVVQRAVRPWPTLPPSHLSVDYNSRPNLGRIPPPPIAPPPLPPKGIPGKVSLDEETEPRASYEQNTRTAASSVIYGSDIVRGKRRYDPTRNVADVDVQRNRSVVSTQFTNTPRDSNVSGWPRTETEYHVTSTNPSLRRDYHSRRRKDTFGARSRRSERSTNRRASFDLLASIPTVPFGQEPESPSSAPTSRMSIVPVVPPGVLSPPLVNPNAGRSAVATGVAPNANGISDSTNLTRVRFGARPMRSALLADGFREPEEDGMPRRLLQNDKRTGFDKIQ